eukprot:TRINITY_DN812_c0_g1_i2.p2 TRINITY_DN812_c0_g1~~TRINITY_DN812_c0_g1_i2.p2  ORF type:complete len:154 (-),score=16.74 TRINITY_DN812_c0_g1_i2:86-547(-)
MCIRDRPGKAITDALNIMAEDVIVGSYRKDYPLNGYAMVAEDKFFYAVQSQDADDLLYQVHVLTGVFRSESSVNIRMIDEESNSEGYIPAEFVIDLEVLRANNIKISTELQNAGRLWIVTFSGGSQVAEFEMDISSDKSFDFITVQNRLVKNY